MVPFIFELIFKIAVPSIQQSKFPLGTDCQLFALATLNYCMWTRSKDILWLH